MLASVVEIIWKFSWIMFGLSFFTSKSGLSIFSSLLIIISVFYVDWKAFLKEKWLVLFVMTLPLGMFLNLFSLGGWESSLKFFFANPWPLMIIPGFHLIRQEDKLKFFLWPLSLSLVAAMLKAVSIFYLDYGLVFTPKARVASFFDIGRWGQFVGAAAIALMGLSYPSVMKTKKVSVYVRTLFSLSCLFLLLSNTRGPWLGFAAGAIFIVVAMRKYFKFYAVVAVVITAFVFSNETLSSRVGSIFKVEQDSSGRITSQDGSNAGRLHMWKVALDRFPQAPFFGTGFRNSEEPIRTFLSTQPPDYLEKYTRIDFSYNDAHSGYLQTLLEMGVLYTIFFWGLILSCFVVCVRAYLLRSDVFFLLAMSLTVNSLIVFIFYSSYASYESLLIVVAVPLCILYAKENSRTLR